MTLLFAIVIAVSVTVVVVGGQALEDRQQATSMEGASTSFQRLDADLAQVASGSQQQVSVPDLGSGTAKVQGDRGAITITVTDSSGHDCPVVDEEPLGRVVYEEGDRTLAYQGGGIFERTAGTDESAVVSAPPIQYQDRGGAPTLSLPLVVIDDKTTGNDVSFERVGKQEQFPRDSCSLENPIPDGSIISITVTSDFYQAWGEVFQQRTGETPSYDHSANKVTVEIKRSSGSDETIDNALSMSSSTKITNSAGIDSYGAGGYGSRWENNGGDVVVDGDIKIDSSGSPQIHGDVVATGKGKFTNEPDVYGKTILGGHPHERTKVKNDARFHDVFTTRGDLSVDSGPGSPVFESDVIVGGDVTRIRETKIKGDLHVGGGVSDDVHIDHVTVEGDVYVGGTFDGANDGSGTRNDLEVQGNISTNDQLAIEDSLDFQGDVLSAGDEVRVVSGTHEADILSEGDVVIESGATVTGNVTAAGTVTVDGDVVETASDTGGDVTAETVHGKSNVEGDVDESGPSVGGLGYEDLRDPLEPDVPEYDSAGPRIDDKGTTFSTDDDNGRTDVSALESHSDECQPDPCQVPPGQYDLDSLHLTPGGTLEFQANSESIEVYVDGEVHLKGEVKVQGSESVRIYTTGDYVMDDGSGEIGISNDEASRFMVYMKPGNEAELSNGANFTGVLYGPGSDSEPASEIKVVNDDTVVKGALVGQPKQSISNDAVIHYDERLSSVDPLHRSPDDDSANVGYLHVTTTHVSPTSE
ncbi:DUF7289 family protein [Halomicrobium salinisoli]|uniref:DUF7289 family protein n=1 Tax=Halomicrobium salinisoli TaxID=2878391 RepID=UPI001CEFDAD2|nr:polymer-forming cytoskeletal protein [Halomicrobium salinisoli]